MELDQSKIYLTPLQMGPLYEITNRPRFEYKQLEVLAFQYLTDRESLEDLLPAHYRPGKEPMVTVMFAQNNGLSFMAGGGYGLAAVMVSARFDGQQDHLEGDLILVMFENQTGPIISGREVLGVPKLYADISPIKVLPDGRLRCEASLWGHMLFGLDVPPLKQQNVLVRTVAARQLNSRPWLGHKYIPSLDGPPDADYPTVTINDTRLEKLWLGKKASLRFGTARVEDIGSVKPLLDALATLSTLRPLQAVHFNGSTVLRTDLSRRLR